jgi:putative copper resistance protein D
VALFAALATIAFALFGPLEQLGRDGSLVAHVAQHLLLGDVAAPLLLLGVPATIGARLAPPLHRRAFVPGVALAVWAVGVTVWYLPPVHRAAVESGAIHVLDHVSFLVLGLLAWLAVFDVRKPGLPWWGRHLYAVGSRTLMVPAAVIVWFAPGFGDGRVDAASLLIGFEMFLFVGALIAMLIAIAIHEGRRINDAGSS